MKSIDSRLDKIEKKLNLGKEPRVEEIIIFIPCPEGTAPPNFPPESYKTRATYKQAETKAIEISKVNGWGFVLFFVDPFKEYELQNNMPEGILSKHEQKGKIPFNELLDLVAKSNEK